MIGMDGRGKVGGKYGFVDCKARNNPQHQHSQYDMGASLADCSARQGRIVAWRAVETVIDAGAAWLLQDKVFATSQDEEDKRHVRILRLKRAIRRERALGYQGHWSYNPSRHLALLQALRTEKLRNPLVNYKR